MFFFSKRLRKSTPEDDERLARAMEENDVGLKDKLAMIVSAFVVLVLPSLLVLLVIAGIALLIFGGF